MTTFLERTRSGRVQIVVFIWLLASVALSAQEVPVEVPVVLPRMMPSQPPPRPVDLNADKKTQHCPGCDCLWGDCFSPSCDCTLPVTAEWAQAMLAREQVVLQKAYPDKLMVRRSLKIRVLETLRLAHHDAESIQGLYGDGVIRLAGHLSRRDASAVIAHEYAHAWQAENHPGFEKVDAVLVEGFAEWVAFQVLKRLGDWANTDRIRRNNDAVYGRGVRWFLSVEAEKGLPVVWEMATTWIDMKGERLPARPPPPPPEEETP